MAIACVCFNGKVSRWICGDGSEEVHANVCGMVETNEELKHRDALVASGIPVGADDAIMQLQLKNCIVLVFIGNYPDASIGQIFDDAANYARDNGRADVAKKIENAKPGQLLKVDGNIAPESMTGLFGYSDAFWNRREGYHMHRFTVEKDDVTSYKDVVVKSMTSAANNFGGLRSKGPLFSFWRVIAGKVSVVMIAGGASLDGVFALVGGDSQQGVVVTVN